MPGVVPIVRHPGLGFSRRGSTWRCSHKDPTWPIVLYARDIYHGTGRLLTTLTLDRHDIGRKNPIRILTSSIDLLTTSQRTRFAEEAASRLDRAQGGTGKIEKGAPAVIAITSMLDAMQERLSEVRHEIEAVSLSSVKVPDDLAPRYTVWPLVPAARPGMLVAPSGSGKSSLAGVVGLSVVSGIEFIEGIQPRETGPVIYIGQEEDAIQMRVRIEMMIRGHRAKVDLRHFHFVKLRGGSLIDSAELIAELSADLKAKLVIVDSAQATWGSGDEGVREYASKWFNAVEILETPTLIVEHPNAPDTRKNGVGAMVAAGSGVKRDRAGHVWAVRSTEIPVQEGLPFRYHVTLTDTKRNYVARQPNIYYEVQIFHHQWSRFQPAENLTAEAVVDATRQWGVLASIMRTADEEHEEGWTASELQDRLKMKDDRRIRAELTLDVWRPTDDGFEEKAEKVEGSGTGRTNPARFRLLRRIQTSDPIQLSMAPGDDGQVS